MFGVGGEHDLSERSLAPCGLARQPAGPGRQRRLGPEPGRRVRRTAGRRARLADRWAASTTTPSGSWWRARTRPPAVDDQGPGRLGGAGRGADFLYSKVMCWVALDRAIAMADGSALPPRGPGGRDPRGDRRHRAARRLERGGRCVHPVFGSTAQQYVPARRSCWASTQRLGERRPAPGRRARAVDLLGARRRRAAGHADPVRDGDSQSATRRLEYGSAAPPAPPDALVPGWCGSRQHITATKPWM